MHMNIVNGDQRHAYNDRDICLSNWNDCNWKEHIKFLLVIVNFTCVGVFMTLY